MSREETYELIERYLEGQLQGEELDIFRIRLKEDVDLAYDLEVQRLIRSELQKKRKDELKALIADSGNITYIQNIWGKRWMYASAAIVLFFVASFFVVEYVLKPGTSTTTEQVGKEKVPLTPPTNEGKSSDPNKPIERERVNAQENSDVLAVLEPEMEVNENDNKEENTFDEVFSGGFDDTDTTNLFDEENDVVLKDELITRRPLTVAIVAGPQIRRIPSVEPSQPKKTKSDETPDDDAVHNNEQESGKGTDHSAQEAKIFLVEYWKSPVNFTGYMLKKGILRVYGISPDSELLLKEFELQTYMKYKATWYILTTSEEPVHFKKISDRSILQWLEP